MPRILDLVLPTPCVICSQLGSPLCIQCKNTFATSFIPIEICGVVGFGISEYTPQVALLVNSIKEKGLTSLIPLVVDFVLKHWPKELLEPTLVPLPSSPENNKKRGFSHTVLLSKALTRRLPRATLCQLLRPARSRRDQVGLTSSERTQNMEGAFKAALSGFRPSQAPIVLIDDVLTSGASMASAIEVLRTSGVNVASFCVIARVGSK